MVSLDGRRRGAISSAPAHDVGREQWPFEWLRAISHHARARRVLDRPRCPDRYGHLMPGNESEAARLLDDYLRRASDPEIGGEA